MLPGEGREEKEQGKDIIPSTPTLVKSKLLQISVASTPKV